jgi:hypothetical protein
MMSLAAAALGVALVVHDGAQLRAAPRGSAPVHAVLAHGEAVEVRAERLDWLQVYDHRRERGGYVRAREVRRLALSAEEAPELLAVVRFLRDRPGMEALGIGFVAAWLHAVSAEEAAGPAGIEALDALGAFAERLARRGASGRVAHLDVAARYGVKLASVERDGRVHLCYDGEAFRRVLALPSSDEQRARAALGLTRRECRPPDDWSAEVLGRVDAAKLPGYLRNRVLARRAAVWASLAYQRARRGEAAEAAGKRALDALGAIERDELAEEDARAYREAAIRVKASRWAALPAGNGAAPIATVPGAPGETCILVIDGKGVGARRCTYALVWKASARASRDGTAIAVAVQPMEAWLELWLFRKARGKWSVTVLPPATVLRDAGYVELAGWAGSRPQVVRAALR